MYDSHDVIEVTLRTTTEDGGAADSTQNENFFDQMRRVTLQVYIYIYHSLGSSISPSIYKITCCFYLILLFKFSLFSFVALLSSTNLYLSIILYIPTRTCFSGWQRGPRCPHSGRQRVWGRHLYLKCTTRQPCRRGWPPGVYMSVYLSICILACIYKCCA